MRDFWLVLAIATFLGSPAMADPVGYPQLGWGSRSAADRTTLSASLPDAALDASIRQELTAAADVFGLQFQLAFRPTTNVLINVSQTPLWENASLPPSTHGLMFSPAGLESARRAFADDDFARIGLPYLAGWACAAVLNSDLGYVDPATLHNPFDDQVLPAAQFDQAKTDALIKVNRRIEATEIIAGWWLAQQPDTTAADCELIAAWRAPADSIVSPAIPLRIGYGLGDHTYAELRTILGLDVH